MRQLSVSQLTQRLQQRTYVQGPLAGVSTVAFRRLIWRYSQPAWVCSEMISAKSLFLGRARIKERYLAISEEEGPLCIQIAADTPEDAAKACEMINPLDVSMIDLNAGCPVKKIRQRGQGSALLAKPETLRDIILAMRAHSRFPISVKIRVDGVCSDYNQAVLRAINQARPDFLSVHARSYLDGYDIPVRMDQLAWFARHADMPVIGNGDVRTLEQTKAFTDHGCQGVMISRASVGAPWLIGTLQAKLADELPYETPSPTERWEVFVDHIAMLSCLLGNDRFALAQAQGLIKYYQRHNNFSHNLVEAVQQAESVADLSQLKAC